MTARDFPAALVDYAAHIEKLQWTAALFDVDWRMAWVSPELRGVLNVDEDADVGYGRHIAECFARSPWVDTVPFESQLQMFTDLAPFFAADLGRRGLDVRDVLPQQLGNLITDIEPAEPPSVWSTSFMYADPRGDDDVPAYPVRALFLRLHALDGSPIGSLVLFHMGVRPNLMVLLACGDQHMYERMAKLVEPGRREAAILFCDLHASGSLSRRLPTANYFRLVRRLWSEIDRLVARNTGIVGKHAGDGATAFFLVDDLGGASAAARAAIATARRIHELSSDVFADVSEGGGLMKIGLHWGANLYMGQLVPGGRLDVTALGDEVNEAARIEEGARAREILCSKQLVERLTADDAAQLGIDPLKLTYRPLAEVAPQSEKVVRDAGMLAVTVL